jgi:hypothetical protein
MQLLALVGFTIIVVRGSLIAPLRRLWPSMLSCATCSGFWIGALGSSLFSLPLFRLEGAVIAAGVVSLGATFADFLLAWLDAHSSAKDEPR